MKCYKKIKIRVNKKVKIKIFNHLGTVFIHYIQ